MMLAALCLVLGAAVGVICQGLPPSPCPRVFAYEARDGVGWFGHLQVPTFHPRGQLHVTVRLLVRAALLKNGQSRLRLRAGRDEAARRVFLQDSQTVDYEVQFPVQSPLPEVDQVTVNKRVICQAPLARPRSGVVTKVFLEHTLYPMIRPVGSPSSDHRGVPPAPTSRPQKTPPARPHVAPSTMADIEPRLVSQQAGPCGVAEEGRQPRRAEWDVDRGDSPWLAALYRNNVMTFICGGTLVGYRHVLTAAHCVRNRHGENRPIGDVIAVLGKHDLNQLVEPGNQLRRISGIHIHPHFDQQSLTEDIAVLVLEAEVEYTALVRPVCVWDSDNDISRVVGQFGTVVGWGRVGADEPMSRTPRKVQEPIVSQEQCLRSHAAFRDFTGENTFCAGGKDGSGPCSGDSGGPLLLPRNHSDVVSRWYLRGIISHSLTDRVNLTCDLGEYVVYTDVAKYQSWLKLFID